MWENLLLLLPKNYLPYEVEFHRSRSLRVYRQVVDNFYATGYRDKEAVKMAYEKIHYSMNVLQRTDPTIWKKINDTHNSLMNLRGSVFKANVAHMVVSRP
jgi:hypothetical protein